MRKKMCAYSFVEIDEQESIRKLADTDVALKRHRKVCEKNGFDILSEVTFETLDCFDNLLKEARRNRIPKDAWLLISRRKNSSLLDGFSIESITEYASVAVFCTDGLKVYPKQSDYSEALLASFMRSKFDLDKTQLGYKRRADNLIAKIDEHNQSSVGKNQPVSSIGKEPKEVWWARSVGGKVVQNEELYPIAIVVIDWILNERISIRESVRRLKQLYPSSSLSGDARKRVSWTAPFVKKTLTSIALYGDREFDIDGEPYVAKNYYRFCPLSESQFEDLQNALNGGEFVDIIGKLVRCKDCGRKLTPYLDASTQERRYRCTSDHFEKDKLKFAGYSIRQHAVEDAIFRVCVHKMWHFNDEGQPNDSPYIEADKLRSIKDQLSTRPIGDGKLDTDWTSIDSNLLDISRLDLRSAADKLASAYIDEIVVYRRFARKKPKARRFFDKNEQYLIGIIIKLKSGEKFKVIRTRSNFVLTTHVAAVGDRDYGCLTEHMMEWGEPSFGVWVR